MAICDGIIASGITKDCATINAAVGVDKDLILVNYEDFDKTAYFPIHGEKKGDTTLEDNGIVSGIDLVDQIVEIFKDIFDPEELRKNPDGIFHSNFLSICTL